LLVQAQQLDDVFQSEGQENKGKPEQNKDQGEEMSEVETADEFEERINRYVHGHLERASTSKRDQYKDELVYQARKEAIKEFLDQVVKRKKCQNCDAYVSPTSPVATLAN
jgi:hypothetical protein